MGTSALVVETPLGWVAAVARSGHLAAVSLPETTAERALAACGAEAGCDPADGLLARLGEDLGVYFRGRRVDLVGYPVELAGQPEFRRRALLAARGIPYGEVRTYGWLARRAGSPQAARAAGHAMSVNPLPLVIPCHRVVGASGALTGFGGGLALKRRLLELEGIECYGNRVLGV